MYESIMKNTYNAIKQLCLYYTCKHLWQGQCFITSTLTSPPLTHTKLPVENIQACRESGLNTGICPPPFTQV